MRTHITTAALLAVACATASAQTDADEQTAVNEQFADTTALPPTQGLPIDTAFYLSSSDLVPDTVFLRASDDELFRQIPDSLLVERLQALNSPIPLTYNIQVRRFIELYVVRRRELLSRMLAQAEYYFPIFEETLDRYDMPLELKYMVVIESAMNPRALSRVGASGLWQFMYYTGKRFGLEVTSYIDERRDPVKASDAAARYLKELYAVWGDWQLAIAAYNCGPGNVKKAIARSGGKRTFWEIYYNLPRETRGYVPAFIAAAYAMNYAAEHKIYPDRKAIITQDSVVTVAADTVMVYQPLHLQQVADVLGANINMLRDMNPMYRHDVVPALAGGPAYPLRLPEEMTAQFVASEDSVYARDRAKYFPDNKIVPISDAVAGHAMPGTGVHLIYKVKAGDVPGAIATKFGVRLADLKYWNGMRRNIIRVGQKLHIYVPKSRADKYKEYMAK